jgi:tetratricopeptide (TPR) repeat protein
MVPSSLFLRGGDYQRDSYRIEVLLPGYIALPPQCLLKAQAGFVIGTHFLRSNDKDDWLVAERMLYECVYCLDQLDTDIQSIGILSELGIQALVTFADALCKNGTYQYGLLAYEAAITAYKLVTSQDFHKMTRRLCGICRENRDWDRALKYHMQILNSANKQDNTTEVVYITERISAMQCDMGNFRAAQDCLKIASLKLMEAMRRQEVDLERLGGKKKDKKDKKKKVMGKSGREKVDALVRLTSFKLDENAGMMHSHFFTLRTKLAQVYLAKEQLPEAINLLEKLSKSKKRDKKVRLYSFFWTILLFFSTFDSHYLFLYLLLLAIQKTKRLRCSFSSFDAFCV